MNQTVECNQGRSGESVESSEFPVGRFTFGPVEDFFVVDICHVSLSPATSRDATQPSAGHLKYCADTKFKHKQGFYSSSSELTKCSKVKKGN